MARDTEVFGGGIAVITGAGAGIGAGFARRAGALGMRVVVTDISAERAETVAASIRKAGGEASAHVVDVSKPEALDRLAQEVNETIGTVRLLVNNAGIETLGYTWEIPIERWEATLNINIHGVVHGARAFLPYMLESGEPAYIANLASIGAMSVMPTQTAYIMTKHAIQAFSECLFLEMQMLGAPIHVSSVLPSSIRTSIFDVEAGEGEPSSATQHRKVMFDLLDQHGMDPLDAAERFLSQIADKQFWVSSHPADTQAAIDRRVRFLQNQEQPFLSDQARQLLGLSA